MRRLGTRLGCTLLVGLGSGPACRPPLIVDDSAAADVLDGSAAADTASDALAANDSGAMPLNLPSLAGPCTPAETRCAGVELDTCASKGDGWVRAACFPGTFCEDGACKPIGTNLVLVFDTSGSMSAQVPGVACEQLGYPDCTPEKGCTRMDVSKTVFKKIVAGLDPGRDRVALLHFPARIERIAGSNCAEGLVAGFGQVGGDDGAQSVTDKTAWFWTSLHEILSVPFPRTGAEAAGAPQAMASWMDGTESLLGVGSCVGPPNACAATPDCSGGACCNGQCVRHSDPELRAVGGTPLAKTLFYAGEYVRNRIAVDGRGCAGDADCGTPYHRCLQGVCVDPARHCRTTTVVVFTDGGQDNDPTTFFAPLTIARRLAYGLKCQDDSGCVGGAQCVAGRCRVDNPTGKRCLATGAPCLPTASEGDPLFCPAIPGVATRCEEDPLEQPFVGAAKMTNNVLRAADGAPLSLRVQVVDVSGSAAIPGSFALASAGGGRVFTADTADPAALLVALEAAFDLKNKKVCGNTQ